MFTWHKTGAPACDTTTNSGEHASKIASKPGSKSVSGSECIREKAVDDESSVNGGEEE